MQETLDNCLKQIFQQLNGNSITVDEATNAIVSFIQNNDITSFEYHCRDAPKEQRPGNIGANAIAKALRIHSGNINSLALSDCLLEDEGVAYIAKILPHTNIRHLKLSGCWFDFDPGHRDISGVGAKAIVDVLPKTKITSLDLSNNDIADAIYDILNVLPKTHITSLYLQDNPPLSLETVEYAAEKVIDLCPQLMHFELWIERSCGEFEMETLLLRTIDDRLERRRAKAHNRREVAELYYLKAFPSEYGENWIQKLPPNVFKIIIKFVTAPYVFSKWELQCFKLLADNMSQKLKEFKQGTQGYQIESPSRFFPQGISENSNAEINDEDKRLPEKDLNDERDDKKLKTR